MPTNTQDTGSTYSAAGGELNIAGAKRYGPNSIQTIASDAAVIYVDKSSLIYIDGGSTFTLSKPVTNGEISVVNRSGSDITVEGISILDGNGQTLLYDGTNWYAMESDSGAVPTLTNGQLVFGGPTGNLTQDSNLFWDNSAKELGIGTSSPGATLDVNGASIFQGLSTWDLGTTPANAILLDMEVPSSSENRDSHSIIFRGALYDGTGKSFDWKVFNDVDDGGEGPNSSTLTFSYRQDAAAFADLFTFRDDGRLFVEGLTVNTNSTSTKELIVSNGEFRMTGNVEDSTTAFNMSSNIVGTSGIAFASLFDIGGITFVSITTDGTSINYPTVSTMSLGEPKITVGAGDTIDAACTMYIKNAPTEGTNNYALFVDDGDARFDGEIQAESGVLRLAEITTPSADANYGKVYTKTDNKLYFQDGAGTEHEIAFV